MAAPSTSAADPDLERRIVEEGKRLLAAARGEAEGARPVDRWLEHLLERVMEDESFRVQALRFVDVLPALDDDRELTRHLHEYFGEEGFPLPPLIAFGVRHVQAGIATPFVARAIRKSLRGLARRFLGGATAEETLERALLLRRRGIGYSLDLVGEAVVSEAEALRYQRRYLDLLARLGERVASWPDCPLLDRGHGRALPRLNVSIKPSSLYSQLNPADPGGSVREVCARLRPVLCEARRLGAFVCIDMEQFPQKDITLLCLKRLLLEPELRDWPDIGIAVQAYLRETEADLQGLIDWARTRGAPVTVRLVRGAYWDQETVIALQHGWTVPVWTRKWQTDACYERCLDLLLQHHPAIETAVGTHNVRSIALAMVLGEARGLCHDQIEFQMLHGMAPALQGVLPTLGRRLRVYLPFGEVLPAMAYLVRRLLENTSSQSFQRMSLTGHLSPAELLGSPHGDGPSHGSPSGAVASEPTGANHPVSFQAPFVNEPTHRFTSAPERDGFARALSAARAGLGGYYPLRIDGRSVDATDTIVSVNPAKPSEIVGRVARAEARHVDEAIAGALRAQTEWAGSGFEARAACLLRAASALRERRDAFSAFEVFEAGKNWQEADANVTEAIDYLEFYAREAMRLGRPRAGRVPGEDNRYEYRPRGIGVVIPPWNFPLAILTGMLSAAIVAGNGVILKPSSLTPVIAARFVALLEEAGVPPGIVQFLPGAGAAIGDRLVAHPEVSFIAFTGSEEIGTRILRLAAEVRSGQTQIKHVIAEMGGKNAIIVDSDADLDDAVTGVVHSAFGYQGQKCSACSRVVVVGPHYPRFVARLVEAAESLSIGAPESPSTFLGPVIDGQAQDRILAAIASGRGEAKPALQVDCAPLGEGYFVGPAIFTEVKPESYLGQEEIFGPVLSVMRAKDLAEAIAMANGTRFALTGGIYSRSPGNIERARRDFEVGNLYINRKITGALVDRHPFGGFKHSGAGSKAGGPDYLLHFLLPRTVTENTLRRSFAPWTPGTEPAA
jgi:RHH-type transcriptional regulator, proline utilization regulon repressor / proline dehydrogenase / delta 1-pyrroline-5-carboxylate dehydrogenase